MDACLQPTEGEGAGGSGVRKKWGRKWGWDREWGEKGGGEGNGVGCGGKERRIGRGSVAVVGGKK